MPKTQNAFAFRRLYESFLNEDVYFRFHFWGGQFDEPEINPGVDRIGHIERGIRAYKQYLSRGDFLLNLVERHIRRLKKFQEACDTFSPTFRRCCDFFSRYEIMVKDIPQFRECVLGMLKNAKYQLRTAFNEETGNRLRLARRRKAMKQDDVAAVLGVKKTAYSHYELGRREIPPLFLYKLAKLFDVPADWLLMIEK